MVWTFVVYYRIHLNLNLEASARQWPNSGTLRPREDTPPPEQTHEACEILPTGGFTAGFDESNHQTSTASALCCFLINSRRL